MPGWESASAVWQGAPARSWEAAKSLVSSSNLHVFVSASCISVCAQQTLFSLSELLRPMLRLLTRALLPFWRYGDGGRTRSAALGGMLEAAPRPGVRKVWLDRLANSFWLASNCSAGECGRTGDVLPTGANGLGELSGVATLGLSAESSSTKSSTDKGEESDLEMLQPFLWCILSRLLSDHSIDSKPAYRWPSLQRLGSQSWLPVAAAGRTCLPSRNNISTRHRSVSLDFEFQIR